MRLRRVRLRENGGFSVALRDGDRWIPVVPALARHRAERAAELPGLAAVARDVVAFCAELENIRVEVDQLLELVRAENLELESTFHADALLPFAPVSFRDFMLYEEHAIAAARGMVKRFMPGAWRFVSAYESVFGTLPARMRPKPIWYEKPIYYMGSHINFFADGDTLPWPAYTSALDYELELGAVICRPLHDASPEQALRAIGGFVVVNDVSARDVQYPEMTSGFGPVKAKNFANAMSTELVTADEILPRITELNVEVRINGTSCGLGTTAGMHHSIGEMAAYASLGERVIPGELLATGTIPGCSGMETGQWLAPGDEIELKIDGIGTLRNVVGTPAASR
ncbi:MAG: fumarylacetoacetate hydrolase family protein [Deltaproteobacteria bacterium]|nr:fumarylacetoacetate hydrolase family protein [Deltaproteobacteria bacterium]MBT8466518.1 fumarylacetoacetate hydrolase family protein [Deltaproteobacteria bacterium]